MNTEHDNKPYDEKGSYRDAVATISKEGKRNFINPKKPSGKLYNKRTIFSIFYLTIFFGLPFIYLNDEPLFMLNVLERKFIIFGMIFWPQDFFIFGLAMITFIVFIILFTVIFGRIFCGWACPQTIFMEMVFRKIEYWIDGDATQQKKLSSMPWNSEKITKRTLKFVTFFLIAFLIANFFLAYLIGMRNLQQYISTPAEHVGTLISLLIFTTVFFFVYWWFREQVCIVVCPYGRLQGVLLDKNSIIVAYDHVRGEPRGKHHHKESEQQIEDTCVCTDCDRGGKCKDIATKFNAISSQGDCIDCNACVRVCPTGIDIRNGTQLECINCTACIDACDAIMTSTHQPTGLIRYASENSIREGKKLSFNARIKAYSTVLLLLLGLLTFFMVSRSDLDAKLMRTSGMTYTSLPDSRIANLYNLKLTNKTHKNLHYQMKLENMEGEISIIGLDSLMVKKEDYSYCQFFVKLHREQIHNWKTILQIGLYENGKRIKVLEAKFIGPEIYN